MKRFTNSRKFLFGVAVSMMLAMAVCSFAMGETQTPASPSMAETPSVATTNGACPFAINGSTNFDYASPVLTLHQGDFTISTSGQTTERIVVDGAANITLNGVNIAAANGAALTIADNATFAVNILLADGTTNILKGKPGNADPSRESGCPGIQKNGTNADAGRLTIGVPRGSEGTGKLEATGGDGAAGIGSGYDESGSCNIKINGGIITATGGICAAGIGGGATGSGSAIEITGGFVTAAGTSISGVEGIDGGGAGIGGGVAGDGSQITISGGKVAATGGSGAAGIGGGTMGNGYQITISGGVVSATGGILIFSEYLFAGSGIGGGGSGIGLLNSLNGDAVVLAASAIGDYEGVEALQGFDISSGGSLTRGIVFTGAGSAWDASLKVTNIDWDQYGAMYGSSVKITEDVKFPAAFTIEAGKEVTVGDGAELTAAANKNLTVKGTLKNEGNVNFTGVASIICSGNGKVETLLKYDPQGGTCGTDSEYKLYQDVNGTTGKTYQSLPQIQTTCTFNGWNTKADGTGDYITESTAVDLNLHTIYADIDYTVTFYSQGGSEVAPITLKYNSKVNKPEDPTKDGYSFKGWYKEADCTNAWNFDSDTVQANTDLYAKWVQQYTVTFSVPTGTAPQAQNVDTGGKATDPQFSWTDGTVEGWYKENTYQNKWNFSTSTVTSNITLYAKFTCSVTFNSQGGSTVAGATAVYNNPVAEPTAPTRSGYRFDGWYKESACTNRWTFTTAVTSNTTLYAKWVQQYTVTFSVPTGTAPAAQTLDTGGKATDPQLSWTDGTVEGWYTDQAFTPANKWNFGTDTVTGNITLYAKFQCTVTFNPNYSGDSSTTSAVVYNNTATDPAPTRVGYRLEGWYKESACTNRWTFTTAVTKDMTLYAKWVQQYTVTFSVPTGTAPQAQNVDTGGKATDPQFSWTDGTVEGWYKENTYQNKWNFSTSTVTSNITLYAKFTCSVTFNSQGGSTVAGETVVYDNTVQEPDEPTRDGYSFVEWCKEAECTNPWNFENDKVQGDATIYAKWLGDEHNVTILSNPDDHGTVTTDPENPKTGDEVIITSTPKEGYEIDGLPIVKTEDDIVVEVIPTGNPNEYKFIMPNSDVTIETHFVLIPEPAVDPDGGDSSSSSSKTSDPFMGKAALAIFGVATTGAVLFRKRK